MDDTEYYKTLNNLTDWTKKWLVVLTWRVKPKNIKKDDYYQKYRDFTPFKESLLNTGFVLIAEEPIPFDDLGCLWIFKRHE
jgi:hypothetical protein